MCSDEFFLKHAVDQKTIRHAPATLVAVAIEFISCPFLRRSSIYQQLFYNFISLALFFLCHSLCLSVYLFLSPCFSSCVLGESMKNMPQEYFAYILSMIRNLFSKYYKLIIYPYLHLNSKF